MANQTGQGSAIPTIARAGTVNAGIEQVAFGAANPQSSLAGSGAMSVGEMLSNMNTRMQDRLDIAAAVHARTEGAAAGAAGIPPKMDDATIRGAAFNKAAQDALLTQYELQARLQMSEYAQKHQTDPTGFQNASASWLKGALPKLQSYDPAIANSFAAEYQLRSEDQLNRIRDAHNAVLRDAAQENALKLQLAIHDDLATSAQTLFSGNPDEVKTSIAKMMTSAGRLVDATHQFGPDGRPLFDAAQRVAAEKAAADTIGQTIGQAWLAQQPSPIEAWHTWNTGGATVKIGDGKGNVVDMKMKDLLGSHIYASVQKGFMENLRSDLALQSQIQTQEDHAFKKSSDNLYGTMAAIGQEGKLTLNMVEDVRPQLEDDRYIVLRQMARAGGASISDGSTLSRLTTADIKGEDIRGQLTAAHDNGELANTDYLNLYQRNTERLSKGVQDAVSAGRDYVGGSLGKLSKELGFAQAISIPQAQAEYEVAVQDFITKHERQPTLTESLDIGRDVVRRYSMTDVQEAIYSLPLPELMPTAMKVDPNLKAADIAPVAQKTKDFFLKKHNGNVTAMEQDEEYRREALLLKDYYDRLILKEQQNAGPARTTK